MVQKLSSKVIRAHCTRTTTVLVQNPKVVWDLHCFCTSVKNFDPSDGAASKIDLDAKRSILCR